MKHFTKVNLIFVFHKSVAFLNSVSLENRSRRHFIDFSLRLPKPFSRFHWQFFCREFRVPEISKLNSHTAWLEQSFSQSLRLSNQHKWSHVIFFRQAEFYCDGNVFSLLLWFHECFCRTPPWSSECLRKIFQQVPSHFLSHCPKLRVENWENASAFNGAIWMSNYECQSEILKKWFTEWSA